MYYSAAQLLTLLLCLSVVYQARTKRSSVFLRNNGYEGLVVAIGERVKEDPRLLKEIKDVFSSASRHLFIATGRRASFRNITILVPQSWSENASYLPAARETYDKANIVVDIIAEEEEGNQQPFTRQTGGCGQEGEFIHLTPGFLLNEMLKLDFFELRGKAIVHEWGHLRWGLFDEYPVSDDISEHFYVDSEGEVQPTRCSTAIRGEVLNRFGSACNSVDMSTSLYSDSCRFYPSESNGASYMYMSSLLMERTFCDSGDWTDKSYRHNSEAPNLQNKLCFGKSAWDVMRMHRDFSDEANPPVSSYQNFTTDVTFKVVKRSNYVAVVVMDASYSMATDDNYVKLDVAVKNFVRFLVPDGSLIGLVYFSGYSRVASTMTFVNDTMSRESLAQSLSKTLFYSGTSIGEGMRAGLELLRSNGRDPTGNFMIIISDGEENTLPLISSILPSIVEAGVIIDTLLFTTAADPQLIAMSAETGGMAYFYSGANDHTALLDGLTSIITRRVQQDRSKRAITVASRAISLPRGQNVAQSVIIDPGLGKDTRFMFTWSNAAYSFRISLTSPNGSLYDYNAVGRTYEHSVGFSDFVQWGYWTVNIINNDYNADAIIVMQVESKPAREVAAVPILVQVSSSPERNFSGFTQPTTVYAQVSKDFRPVTGASVWATLESPTGSKIAQQLHDSGAGADNVKDDGIYSGYVFNVSDAGHYAVSVRVEGTQKTAVKYASTKSIQPNYGRGFGIRKSRSLGRTVFTGAFERVASGDLITITQNPLVQDRFPPSRIQDLRISAAVYQTREVTLQFTAVGDNYDIGKAHHYILRRSNNYAALLTNFQSADAVSEEEIVSGSLRYPNFANQIEKIVVKVNRTEYIAFSIVAVDAAGNESPPSNVVGTKLRMPWSPSIEREEKKPATPSNNAEGNMALAIGLPVGGKIIIIAINIVLHCCTIVF